jgi:hypothetical protein
MTIDSFIEWRKSDLDAEQRSALLGSLTPAQRHGLLQNDYAWLERGGVVWTPPDGPLRRARFTHAADFETRHGSFRIDSEGSVHAAAPRSDASEPSSGGMPR